MDWLWGAIATAGLGALGFLTNRYLLEPSAKRREMQQHRISALRELQFLLAVSFDAFQNQIFKAQALLLSIRQNHPEIAVSGPEGNPLGYDEIFHKSYQSFTDDESRLFKLIRGTTMTTLHDANSKMQKWIEDNSEFILGTQPNETRIQLSKMLEKLRTHLNEWLAKYVVWIPNDPTRAIVFLGDEKGDGPPFPTGIETCVSEALRTLRP
jgi:hypothetical protein